MDIKNKERMNQRDNKSGRISKKVQENGLKWCGHAVKWFGHAIRGEVGVVGRRVKVMDMPEQRRKITAELGGQHQARQNGSSGRGTRPGCLEATNPKHRLHIQIGK